MRSARPACVRPEAVRSRFTFLPTKSRTSSAMDTVRQDVQLIATHYIARLSFVELGGPRVPLSNISAGLTNLAIICGLVLLAAPWQTGQAAAGSVTGHISG